MRRTSISLIALLGAVSPLAAQDGGMGESEPENDDAAPVIVVTGQGLEDAPSVPAYATRTVTRDELLTVPSGRIEEALGTVAGFQQFRRSDSRSSNPSAQGVTLRSLGGNATSRALVLLDGVPIADPFFGYIPFGQLATERIGRVRVTRGGGAGPFGAGALAGTIGPGFFTTPAEDRVPASARARYDSWSLSLRGVAPVGESLELQASATVFDDQRTLRFEGADSSASGADASLRLVGRGAWEFDALAYVQARDFSNVVISSTRFVRVLDQRDTPSTGLGGKLEVRPPLGADDLLRLGVDYRRSEGELQEDAYSAFSGALTERRRAGGSTSDLGLFAEYDRVFGALVLTGGLRADRTRIGEGRYVARNAGGALVNETLVPERSDWIVSWRGGAAWEASETLRLRAAAYRGLRLPTLNELLRPFVVFPVVTQANAALESETLEGYEAGLDWTPLPNVELALTAFDNRVDGAIANVTLARNLRQRQNLPAIEAQGIEAGLKVTRGALRFDGTLAYTDARVVGEGASLALDGNRPAQAPRWAAAANAIWTPAPGWQVAASLRHTGAQFESDLETDRLPPATTLGLFAQAPLGGGLSAVFRAENVTDERIVTRNSDGNIDLGVPRTFWAGLRLGF